MKSPKTKTSKKPMKARRMWANYHGDTTIVFKDRDEAEFCAMGSPTTAAVVPVAVVPLDDAEEMVKKAMEAYIAAFPDFTDNRIRAALAAIGVLPKKRKGQK